MKIKLTLLVLLGSFLNPIAFADEEGTISLVDENSTPDQVAGIIELPKSASDTAVENAVSGLTTANSARQLGREFGEQMAEDAQGNDISDQIRDNIESETDVSQEFTNPDSPNDPTRPGV